jgi:hypothetical protein
MGNELCHYFGHGPIAVAVGQVTGALVYMVRKYECLHLYPVPSTMSARMLEALYPAGAKGDPRDATAGTACAAPGHITAFDAE